MHDRHARPAPLAVGAAFLTGVDHVVTTVDVRHPLHAPLLPAVGVGALLGRPRTG